MSTSSSLPPPHRVDRQPQYIGDGNDALFAWYHTAGTAHRRDLVAVLCNPLGHEYVHSHRSVRCLADTLARAGIPALRFDYHGTGDSPGDDLEPNRLERWLADIRAAIERARALSGRQKVCLVGIRMGATLAALTAAQTPVDSLVLWGAAVSGRRYVREMQAIAQMGQAASAGPDGALESAGFLLSKQTQEAIKSIQLLKTVPQVTGAALVVERDDMAEEPGLLAHWQAAGIEASTVPGTGFAMMMAEPHKAAVPQETFDRMVHWLALNHPVLDTPPVAAPPGQPADVTFNFTTADGRRTVMHESPALFGEQRSLFGILTRPAADTPGLPTVVLLNSGSVHHVGPGRLYTSLARNLAACGFPTFRCDLEGLGDSVAPVPGLEGHPYPPTAMRDMRSIGDFLEAQHRPQALVLAGVCSGAYMAFHAALDQPHRPLPELLLINPLLFAYDGQEIPEMQSFRLAESGKLAIRRLDNWKKLLRGQIRVGYLLGMALRHLGNIGASHLRDLAERFTARASTLLSKQLQQLFQQRRRITLFLATGEPGWGILHAGARRTAGRGAKAGDLNVIRIRDTDHTFSNEAARERLIHAVLTHLKERFGTGAPSSVKLPGSP